LPYILWVTFAAYLNWAICMGNWNLEVANCDFNIFHTFYTFDITIFRRLTLFLLQVQYTPRPNGGLLPFDKIVHTQSWKRLRIS
jgi:hypothetical protein